VGFYLVYELLHFHFPAALKLNYESLKKFSTRPVGTLHYGQILSLA
jgi:hypothetical protein